MVTIEGEVTDRTSFFVAIKFYKVRDKTGEIIVVTKNTLPELKAILRERARSMRHSPSATSSCWFFWKTLFEQKGSNK